MRTQTINKIIADNGYSSYFEIGTNDASNFHAIKVDVKKGVPNLNQRNSDEFFKGNKEKFDLILIDGNHEAEQVENDIINSYKSLNTGGMILLHDCSPPSEKAQIVPRQQEQWTGDVWRAAVGFKSVYGDKIKTGYFDDPYGLFAIYKTGRFAVKEGFTNNEMTYREFEKNRFKLIGI